MHSQALVLKDGSVIKGQIIEDSEYEVKVTLINGDTLSISHKYVDEVISEMIFKERFMGGTGIPKHKSEGVFIDADIYASPIAVSLGKRMSERWNLGGTLFYFDQFFDGGVDALYGVAACSRFYLGSNMFSGRLFLDGSLGISYRRDNLSFTEEHNRFPPVGSFSFGLQLPSKKVPRFYLKAGVFLHWNETRFIDPGSTSSLIKDRGLESGFQFSIIAIQF